MSISCLAGYGYQPSSNTCLECPAGTYSPGGTIVSCLPVPIGYYNSAAGQGTYSTPCALSVHLGAANCVTVGESICSSGYYYNNISSSCDLVPTAYYNPDANSGIYYYCANSTHSGAALCAAGSSTCGNAGQYYNGSHCVTTPAGYYSPDPGTGMIYTCNVALYPGAASCNQAEVVCDHYTASNTSFGIRNYSVCEIYACPGTILNISGCGTGNGDPEKNDQYLILLNTSNIPPIKPNDDYCGVRSQIIYPFTSGICQLFTLREACYDVASCFGKIAVTGGANCRIGQYYDGLNCVNAPTGFYSPIASSGVYYYCPYSLLDGAGNCEQNGHGCVAGEFYNTSNSQCQTVPAGYMNPTAGTNIYYYCSTLNAYGTGTVCLTVAPSATPTGAPTAPPTVLPTTAPTVVPSSAPTSDPSSEPSVIPTHFPTCLPSCSPSVNPTVAPSSRPTSSPSFSPTSEPTVTPTSTPSNTPTADPSIAPTSAPTTSQPTPLPSATPTSIPTSTPSIPPTIVPSTIPTSNPSCQPTVNPTESPSSAASTAAPSPTPTTIPSTLTPSSTPTSEPTTGIPSVEPTTTPTACPTLAPIVVPTVDPTAFPSTAIPSSIPTTSPTTSLPTVLVTSTPTSAPAFDQTIRLNDVPKVNILGIIPFTNYARLKLSLNPVIAGSGFVICSAIVGNQTILSKRQITTTGQSTVKFPSFSSIIWFNITNLKALKVYDAYCYAENSFGAENSLQDVINSRKTFQTLCCKTISYSTAPSSVYGTSALYTGTQRGNNIFALTLSDYPSSWLSIRIRLFSTLDHSLMNVIAHPDEFNISSSVSDGGLSPHRFMLQADATVSGDYVMKLIVGLNSAAEYNFTEMSVRILGSSDPPVPPSLSSAFMASSGAYITITFDGMTNMGGMVMGRQWQCIIMLEFSYANMSICTWTASNSIKISFGRVSAGNATKLIRPGGTIRLLPNVIGARCFDSASSCSTSNNAPTSQVTVLLAATPDPPVVRLNIPAEACLCDGLLVDASSSSGDAGRPWTIVVWTIYSPDNNAAAISLTSILQQQDISSPIFIEARNLSLGVYFVQLQLTNFLGVSASVTVSVTIHNLVNKPSVFISGSSIITIKNSDVLSINAIGTLPICSSASVVLYYWKIFKNGELQSAIVSTSLYSRKFLLPPYSLTSNYEYEVVVTASSSSLGVISNDTNTQATVTVYCEQGEIVATIVGGNQRSPSIHSAVILDASNSRDSNVGYLGSATTSSLLFTWSCVLETLDSSFGTSCTNTVIPKNFNESVLVIPKDTLLPNEIYRISVFVTVANDNRVGTASVTLYPVDAENFGVVIASSQQDFTLTNKVVINAIVGGDDAAYCSWSITSADGTVVNMTGFVLTQSGALLQASETSSHISFPISINPLGNFVASSTYQFQLTVCKASDVTMCIYSILALSFHTPPAGGSLDVVPLKGQALSQVFTLTSVGWYADSESYPLLYSFYYQLSHDSSLTSIGTASDIAYVLSHLPAGLQVYENSLIITGFVLDALTSVVNSTTTAIVSSANNVNFLNILQQSSDTYSSTGDVSVLFQVVGTLGSTLATKNCSAALKCDLLHRSYCNSVAQTCGDCLSDYPYGVVGPSNTPCIATKTIIGDIGSPCSKDSDCLHNACNNFTRVCVYPLLVCPSNGAYNSNLSCSGNGYCLFTDSSGVLVPNCTVNNVNCRAKCVCTDGYGGDDCSMEPAAFHTISSARVTMCTSLLRAANTQDKSATLVDTLVGSLINAYSPGEMNYLNQSVCLEVLQFIADLCDEGYLSGTQSSTIGFLMKITSTFSSASSDTSTTMDHLSTIMQSITKGIALVQVGGEAPVAIATDTIQLSVTTSRLAVLSNASLSPPATNADIAYGNPLSSIQLSDQGLGTVCNAITFSGYARTAVTQWGLNPYPNASSIKSPMLQYSYAQGMSTGSSYSVNISLPKNTNRRLLSSLSVESKQPAFFVTLQYSSRQDVNVSSFHDPYANKTLPECTLFNGVNYISCRGCNISSFTEYNVTYACYDASLLCSITTNHADSAAVASSTTTTATIASTATAAAAVSPVGYDTRQLQETDGGLTSYGMILVALAGEIASVLSINPFAINLQQAKVVLIFVGCWAGALLLGIMLFRIWDIYDHNKAAYLLESKQRKLREKLSSDKRMHQTAESSLQTPEKSKPDPDKIGKRLEMRTSPSTLKNHISWKTSKISEMDGGLGVSAEDESKEDVDCIDIGDDECLVRVSETITDKNVNQIYDFYNEALPAKTLLAQNASMYRFMYMISTLHPYVCMLSFASSMTTRVMRWLSVCRGILISLFIDTLFFGIFYPSDLTCPGFTSEATCIALPSKIVAGEKLCVWNPEKLNCTLTPPPQDFVFSIVLALLCVLITTPFDMAFGIIMDEFASKRPILEQVGLNSDWWLGSGRKTKSVKFSLTNAGNIDTSDIAGPWNSPLRNYMQTIEQNAINQLHRHQRESHLHTDGKSSALNAAAGSGVDPANMAANNTGVIGDIDVGILYYDSCTPDEEVEFIFREVKRFWLEEFGNPMHNEFIEEQNDAKAMALVDILKVYPNGAPMPLTTLQWLWYGNAHNKLRSKIQSARKKANQLALELKCMEEEGLDSNVDIFLTQHFILEQVSVVTRYALSCQLFNYNELSPFPIDALPWIGAWVVTISLYLFFLYWIFAWGITNGGTTLKSWGINFAIGSIQDFFFVQPLKIFVLHVLSVEAARNQLRAIHRRLVHVATTLLQKDSSGSLNHHQQQQQQQQHRHYHSQLNINPAIQSNRILGSDFRVVQHYSAACRAARHSTVSQYPAAYILRQLNDLDMQHCKENRGWGYGTLLFIFIIIPAAIGLISELFVDGTLEIILPSVFSGFLLFNFALLSISPVVVAIPYAVVVIFVIYKFFILKPSLNRLEHINQLKAYTFQGRRWRDTRIQKSKRRQSHAHSFYFNLRTFVLDKFALGIALLSMPFYSKKYLQLMVPSWTSSDHNTVAHLHWQQMNIPRHRQGEVITDHLKLAGDEIDYNEGADEDDIIIPEPIFHMTSNDGVQVMSRSAQKIRKLLNKFLFDVTTVEKLWKLHADGRHVIERDRKIMKQTANTTSVHCQDVRDVSVTVDVHEALSRMWRWMVLNSNSLSQHHKSKLQYSHFDDAIAHSVSFDEIDYEPALSHVWYFFLPGGMQVSSQVQVDETIEEFRDWAKYFATSNEHQLQHQDQDATPILFRYFVEWFKIYAEEIGRSLQNAN